MYNISSLYEQYLEQRSREWLVKVNIAGTDYGSSSIVDFEIENSLALDDEFELGTAILSKLTLKIKTEDEVPANAKVVPYVALTGTSGDTEWLPLGEFYIDNRDQVRNVWVYECYDKLVWADEAYISQLTYPTTQQAVWDEICTSLGYTYDSSVVINPDYMIQAGPAGFSKRQVMGYIASANGACVQVSKDGLIQFKRFSASDPVVKEITDSDYIRAKQTNPKKAYTRIVVTYDTEDELTYEAGSGDENHTLHIENPFMTQEMVDDLYAQLNGFSYIPVELPIRSFPQLEVGDRIRFGEYVGTPTWETADIAWQDADFSWDGYKSGGQTVILNAVYKFRGGLSMSLEAKSKSEQQSEFVVEGSLSAQINKLNKDTVKFNKPYYGISHSRTEGLVIEREDHLSKLTLNSDEQKWEVDGQPTLYYDALDNRLKFSGEVVMLGGTISWADVNAPDIEDIPDLGSMLTYIGPTGIYSGQITTDQLIAGEVKIGSALIDKIKANQIDVSDGKITAAMIDATELRVDAANIDGTIVAGAVEAEISIESPLITGGEIKTSPSGRRIEIKDDSLRMYDEIGRYDGPAILAGEGIGGYFAGLLMMYYQGGQRMYISPNPTGATIGAYGSYNLNLLAAGGQINIGDGTYVNHQIANVRTDEFIIYSQTDTTFHGDVIFNHGSLRVNQTTSSSASAGFATLPANPQGFIQVNISGTLRKIPYYNA